MPNTSTVQSDGTSLGAFVSNYGGFAANVGGKLQLQSDGTNTHSGLQTDVAGAPLSLDYLEAELYVQGAGGGPKASFVVSTSDAGTRLGFAWDAGQLVPLNQAAYADVTPQGTAIALAAGSALRVAICKGSSASRYVAGTYTAGNIYMFTAPAGSTTWTQRYTCAPPVWITACRIAFLNEIASGTTQEHATIDDVNLLTTTVVPTIPGAVASMSAVRSSTDPTVANLAWTAPADTGNSAITGYRVSDGTRIADLAATATSYTFGALTTTGYTFSVVPKNAVGSGPSTTRSIDAYVPPAGGDGTRPTDGTALPLLSTLVDDFNDASLDPALWAVRTSGWSQLNGTLSLDLSLGKDEYLLLTPADASPAGQEARTKLLGGMNAGEAVGLMLRAAVTRAETNQAKRILFVLKDGVLSVIDQSSGTADPAPAAIPYSATKHGYLRLRSTGGNIVAETAPPATGTAVFNPLTAIWTPVSTAKVIVAPDWLVAVEAGYIGLRAASSTPSNSVPSVPTGVTLALQPDGTSVKVAYAAPASNGGSPVTKYTISRDGADASGTVGWTNTATQPGEVTFDNLQAGVKYTFTVFATNANGDGAKFTGSVTTTAVTGGGSGTGKFDDFTTTAPVGPTPPAGKTFAKRFVDDFTGSAFSSKWKLHRPDGSGDGEKGWGRESYYAANASVGASPDGKTCAILRMDSNLHSGVITTGTGNANQTAMKPGDYLEAYLKTPPASDGAMWPAIWGIGVANVASNGGNGQGVTWPPELDFFEFGYAGGDGQSPSMGDTGGKPIFTVHFGADGGGGPGTTYGSGDLRGQWHTYGVHWRADSTILLYVDGVFTGKTVTLPSKSSDGRGDHRFIPQCIIFSHQIQSTSLKVASSYYYMDWIRLWTPTP